jgi:tryptophan-rich sensory protein
MIPAWLIIAVVALLVGIALNRLAPTDIRWFNRQRRPSWLTFEWAIPWIWITIFICGAWSAYGVWQTEPGTPKTWAIMAGYLILEILILAYTPVMTRLRSLNIGTVIGAIGFFWGFFLIIFVFPVNKSSGLLLLPYLLWSPIGTYVTWVMGKLNPTSR